MSAAQSRVNVWLAREATRWFAKKGTSASSRIGALRIQPRLEMRVPLESDEAMAIGCKEGKEARVELATLALVLPVLSRVSLETGGRYPSKAVSSRSVRFYTALGNREAPN